MAEPDVRPPGAASPTGKNKVVEIPLAATTPGKVHVFFSTNVERVVVHQILFRFATCRSVAELAEIFAIKVESCQKCRRILDVFIALPNFRGRAFQNLTHFITPASRHVAWKKFCEDTPISPEVRGSHAEF